MSEEQIQPKIQEKNISNIEPMDEILFAKNLGIITDMKFGPDGALYVISILEGKIYKIFM